MIPILRGIETAGLLWVFVPAFAAVAIALIVARLNTRYGYGRYNDMEKAIIKAWKRQAK